MRRRRWGSRRWGAGGERSHGRAFKSFLLSHSPVSQNQPSTGSEVWWGERPKKKDRSRGRVAAGLLAGRRELLLVSEMKTFIYKMMDSHNNFFFW